MIRLLKTVGIVSAFFLWIFVCVLIGMLLVHTFGAVPSLIAVGLVAAVALGYDVYRRLGDD